MKTPEKIKRGLLKSVPVHFHGGNPEPRLTPLAYIALEKLLADALAYIQQLEQDNAQKDECIRELEQLVPRWISVEERLPETQWSVIIALKRDGGGIRIAIGSRAHWTPHRYYIDGGTCAIDADRVTHWMPLPAPPEDEKEG